MNSSDIDLFKTLYEEKNITHTAKRLFISQPALSHRLRNLEKEFDCTLVLRQPRGITFTPEGERLYAYCLQQEKDYQAIRAELSSFQSRPAGSISIACSNVFSKYHMPKLLSQFKAVYPQVEIHLRSGFSQHLYRDFREGKFQLCIVRGDRNWEEEKRFLWQDPICAFSKGPLDLTKLPSFPYIHYTTDPAMQDLLDDWWYAHFSQPPMTTIETDAMDTSLKMVQQGLGFTFLTQSCGQDTPGLQAQILTDSKGNPLIRETWLYYRKDYTKLSRLKAFIDFITQAYPLAEDK